VARSTLRTRIEALVARWVPILGLQDWLIALRFDQRTHQATCVAQPQYEEATINFNLPVIARELKRPSEVEDLVVHELCHCVTWNAKVAGFNQEHLTTRVARAILRARKAR
jgi:predicted SprT family Zn-dependent metalloprotease